jgi:hypothetical protein
METLVYASSAAEARNRAQVEGPAAADADDEARHRRAPAAARPLRGRVQGGHGRCRIVLIILTILIHPPSPPIYISLAILNTKQTQRGAVSVTALPVAAPRACTRAAAGRGTRSPAAAAATVRASPGGGQAPCVLHSELRAAHFPWRVAWRAYQPLLFGLPARQIATPTPWRRSGCATCCGRRAAS